MSNSLSGISRMVGAGAFALLLSSGLAESQQTVVPPPAPATPRAAVVADQYSPVLQAHYHWVPYGQAWGAWLSRYPEPGSPLRQLRLEPGDMIYALDGQRLRDPRDLENHFDQTSVDFVNIRTNNPQRGFVFIRNRPGPPNPPSPPNPPPVPSTYVLGVNTVSVPVQVAPAAAPGSSYQVARPSYALRITSITPGSAAARAGLEVGDTIVTANNVATSTVDDLRRALAASNGFVRLTVQDVRTGNYVSIDANLSPVGGGPASVAPTAPPAP